MNFTDKLRIGGARIGRIAFGITVCATFLTLFSAFTPLLFALFLVVMAFVVLITLGTIFILVEDFGSFLSSSTDTFASFAETAFKANPYFAGVAAVFAVISVVLLLLDVRTKSHTDKIVGAIVCAVVSVLLAIISSAVAK